MKASGQGNGGAGVFGSSLGKRNRGFEMNREHYMYNCSQPALLGSCSVPATVTPIFPSVAIVHHVQWLFSGQVKAHAACVHIFMFINVRT